MDESQMLIDYAPPTWREWLLEVLDCGVEYMLLLVAFVVLGALAEGHIYQSPHGPVPLFGLVFFGFCLAQLQIMLWALATGIIEAVAVWALWLTPIRAISCGLGVGIALRLLM